MSRSAQDILAIYQALEAHFPDAKIELNYQTPFQLLVAVVLSAQATDKSVNKVTKELFPIIQQPQDIVHLPLESLEQYIKSIGLYKTKAQALKTLSQQIMTLHHGLVPSTYADLVSLQGVGRKTAHVILNELYNHPVIAVDTHVFRISHRLGLSTLENRDRVGDALMALTPPQFAKKAHHLLIFLGRRICKAQNPQCSDCFLKSLCPSYRNI